MKLKYKKIILLTTMSMMGIGMLTLSVTKDRKGPENGDNNASLQTILETEISPENNTQEDLMSPAEKALSEAAEAVASATPIPTPTEIPVYPVEQTGTYPEIDQLFETYYDAKNNRDIETLKSILSNPANVETEEELQAKTEYIEDYHNITTYTKKGYKDGTYIVYVYHEIKFTSIHTSAPGLAKFYVVTGEDNRLRIFSGELDSTEKAYYDSRDEDEDVVALIEMTEEKSDQAKAKDEDLASFWKSIDEMSKKNTKTDSE